MPAAGQVVRVCGLGKRFGIRRFQLNRRPVTGSPFAVQHGEEQYVLNAWKWKEMMMRGVSPIFLLSIFLRTGVWRTNDIQILMLSDNECLYIEVYV